LVDGRILLGFVPIGSVGQALQMARGHHGPDARAASYSRQPYFPFAVCEPRVRNLTYNG
jgi:hypothetical protein